MKKNWMKWLVIGLICTTPAFMKATKIGVLHLKAVGVSNETAEIVASLLASELTDNGYTVMNPDAMDASSGEVLQCYEKGCAAEAGFKAKVEQVAWRRLHPRISIWWLNVWQNLLLKARKLQKLLRLVQ
jgi:hypothetical protein